MRIHIIVLCLISGLSHAAAQKTLLSFETKGSLISERGSLSSSGVRTVSLAASKAPKQAVVTINICRNIPGKFLPNDLVTSLGKRLISLWGKIRPENQVEWIRRAIPQTECPSGLQVEIIDMKPANQDLVVTYLYNEQGEAPYKEGERLSDTTTIKTGAEQYISLRVLDNHVVTIGANSEVSFVPIKGKEKKFQIRPQSGEIWVHPVYAKPHMKELDIVFARGKLILGVKKAYMRYQGAKSRSVMIHNYDYVSSIKFTNTSKSIDAFSSGNIDVRGNFSKHILGPAPSFLWIDAVDASKLQWSPVTDAPQYLVEIAMDTDFITMVKRQVVPTHEMKVPSLQTGTYYWRVYTVKDGYRLGAYSTVHELKVK